MGLGGGAGRPQATARFQLRADGAGADGLPTGRAGLRRLPGGTVLPDHRTIPLADETAAPRREVEAREAGLSGVDYVSVGAVTHSVRAIDIGLDVVVSPPPAGRRARGGRRA